jgi:hypothetical protein
MKKAFIIVSVSARIDQLNALVRSIMLYPRFDDYSIHLMFQDTHGVAGLIANRDRYETILTADRMLGCHGARVRLLKAMRADFYVNLDDDMTLCEFTNYEGAIAKAAEPGTGFVLTNWAKTMAQVRAKAPKMEDRFVKQVMIYQGGGMVYRDEIADLMRALPEIDQTFDHTWPLTAYINGFLNYRYLGSLAEHRIGTQGGMLAYLATQEPALLMQDYIRFRPRTILRGNGNDYNIPLDSDLLPIAHEEHRRNRIAKGFA